MDSIQSIKQHVHTRRSHKNVTPISTYVSHGIFADEFLRILLLRTLGNFLIAFSLYMLVWVFYKPAWEEVKYAYNSLRGTQYVVADEATDIDPSAFQTTKNTREKGLLNSVFDNSHVQVLVPKNPDFSIVIPKLGANANIIENVDTTNKEAYLEALQSGVAHAAGTNVPGENGHVYLFAHSTNTFSNVSRFNAIFYLLYKLENGDEINVYYHGVRYKYLVTGKEIVDPSNVEYLTKKTETEFLTLQTCWPPGTIAQRMLIFAEPVGK